MKRVSIKICPWVLSFSVQLSLQLFFSPLDPCQDGKWLRGRDNYWKRVVCHNDYYNIRGQATPRLQSARILIAVVVIIMASLNGFLPN